MTVTALPRRGIRPPKRMLTLAFALFLTLAGTTVAQATWTAPGVPISASVSAGTLGITQSGFTPGTFTYSSSALSTTSVVTLTNTGSVPAPYTLTLSAPSTDLATGIDLRAVLVASPGACTAAAAASGTAAQNWASTVVLTGIGATAVAVGAAVYYCVSSTITQAQRFALVGIVAAPKVTLASNIGTWISASTSLSATQTVANTLTPGAPVASATTDHGTTLTWTPSTDAVAISTYQVFRNGTYIGTTTSPATTYTDTGLNIATKYTYTVKAFDAAGDASPASASTAVTTLGINPVAWYKVKSAGSEICIDGENFTTADGTALISYGCKATLFTNQAWKFTLQTNGYYTVIAEYAPGSVWDFTTANKAIISTSTTSRTQDWSVVAVQPDSGTFTIRPRNSSTSCLDTAGTRSTGTNIQLVVKACVAGLASQTFTFTNVG